MRLTGATARSRRSRRRTSSACWRRRRTSAGARREGAVPRWRDASRDRTSGSISCSGPRMSSGVHLADPLTGHVGVQLGRGDTRMTEQLLDDPQVGPTLEQVRREGMTKRVRAHRERQAGHPRGGLDDRERLLAREPCAAIAEEERPAAPRLDVRDREETRPVLRNPPSEPVEGDLADRHEALLVSLADHADEAAIGREVFAIEPERLAHPKTRRVQELE